MKRIQDLKLDNKTVLVRVDYNVPLKDGKVFDAERIQASLETIIYLLEKNAKVVLLSHLGRPDGKVNNDFSLKPVVEVLEKLIKKSVQFSASCVGEERDNIVTELKSGEVLLLENVRFFAEEEANDGNFAKLLANGIDVYINDAFSASHRAHASIVGIPAYVEHGAGFLLQKEVDNLSKLLDNPARPFAFISGGAKISDKINILENLLDKIDLLLIGGGMANTFLCAKGYGIGCSLSEPDYLSKANEIVELAEKKGVALFLPEDAVVTTGGINESSKADEIDIENVGENEKIVDIGSVTIKNYLSLLKDAKTIFWNGPMGIAEFKQFSEGTEEIAEGVANSKVFSVIGGGDTIASINQDLKEKFSFVSMAGGASMEFLEGKELPGITALK